MTYKKFPIYISYSQICIFVSSLENPFNDWNEQHFSQGFSWRTNTVSFRTLKECGDHVIHLHINELVPEIDEKCIRAFRVPFKTSHEDIEIGSISDSKLFQILPNTYILQVEFYEAPAAGLPKINVRLNKGQTEFSILKNGDRVLSDDEFDLTAYSAS